MTKVIAITGGIGSGKTTLSNHLIKLGLPVHDSDKVVSFMYKQPNKNFISFIKNNISEKAVYQGKINKKIITEMVFENNKLKKDLENHVHKEVKFSRDGFIKKNLKKENKAIFIDIPLLFEKKLEKQFDLIVCVISSKKTRIKRAIKTKKFSERILKKILLSQTTDKERRSRSDIIITNNKTKKDFIFAAERALMDFLK